MKYLSIIRYILNYLVAISGKFIAYVLTLCIYPFKDWIRNYSWNFMLSKGFKIDRSTIFSEDTENYYTSKGYIIKRKTNILGYLILIPYFFLDDDANLDCCSTMFSNPAKVKGLNITGSYFELGDAQRMNKINLFDWYTFKQFYYWMVIRNGFYNYNYIIEDSILNSCGKLSLPVSKRIKKDYRNHEEFSEHSFYKDSNNKWFFLMTLCKIYKDKAYGYEIGWRRKGDGGVNQVFRLYFGK